MRTFGVEEEFLIVDPVNGVPLPLSAEVMDLHGASMRATGSSSRQMLSAELHQEQLEVITHPHSSLDSLATEILEGRAYADSLARKAGARIVALATSPLAVSPHPTRNERYDALLEKYALTAREQLTCGFHVHVSVGSDEEGVAVLDRIRSWLPSLMALSSNSPFWNGQDSGYASFRTQAWNRWSSAGPMEVFGSAWAYHALVADLSATGVVVNPDFDARLSARHPTVEIRVSDVCLDPRDTVLIAALVRALVEIAAREWAAGMEPDRVPAIVLRQGVWMASRWGIRGKLLHPATHRPDTARQVISALHDHVRDALNDSGDAAHVEESLERILGNGTGADRQRQSYERNGRLADVVAHAIGVTHQEPVDHHSPGNGSPSWTWIPLAEAVA
ncbi:glutamate--cysteine ligase [Paeniglutamicibacter psychrophenolicus]|uniref:glutamate--cysteine ligase n=1 Tax=Paeniglutamicibacter psychrophenolicus TaxID=257454 RepID=UPI00277F93E8|nr:glutamate--cysteine ligase [Paeniglutamicibacter psychrophenolicus]MDQ0095031.1 carboxylate-amine ligase [Paeniglutamicibacter psychrophenolicus]